MRKVCGKTQFPHSFGQIAFPQNFHTGKLGEVTVFYALFIHNFWSIYPEWLSNWVIWSYAEKYFGEHFDFKICLRKSGALLQSLIKTKERIPELIKSESRGEEYTSSLSYSGPSQTSKMVCYVKMISGFKTSAIFSKRSISNIWHGSEHTSAFYTSF